MVILRLKSILHFDMWWKFHPCVTGCHPGARCFKKDKGRESYKENLKLNTTEWEILGQRGFMAVDALDPVQL